MGELKDRLANAVTRAVCVMSGLAIVFVLFRLDDGHSGVGTKRNDWLLTTAAILILFAIHRFVFGRSIHIRIRPQGGPLSLARRLGAALIENSFVLWGWVAMLCYGIVRGDRIDFYWGPPMQATAVCWLLYSVVIVIFDIRRA